jgi:hypothetical protein
MRYYLDHQSGKFEPVPMYVNRDNGMVVQRFDGPRPWETPWRDEDGENARDDAAGQDAAVL